MHLKIIVLALFIFLSSAFAENSVASEPDAPAVWQVTPAQINSDIRVESTQRNGEEIELVHLYDGESLEIPVDLNSQEIIKSGLTPAEVARAREEARETLELTLRGILSDDFSGSIALDENGEALTVKPVSPSPPRRAINIFKRAFTYNYELYKPMPQGLRTTAKLKRFVQMAWQFVFVETIHAGIDYYRQLRRVAPRFTEFGIAFDLKLEPQVFIAKFNPTQKVKLLSRSYSIFCELGYSRTEHRLFIRSRYRREKGSGGLGLPAVKAEVKVFQSDGTKTPYKGKSWYPVSPPIISFVLDSSEHYYAQGITVGFNSGDIIPGSTLTNTFTQFVQGENLLHINEMSRSAAQTLIRAAQRIRPHSPHLMCSQLFL